MRMMLATAALCVLAGCGASGGSETMPELTATQAVDRTCAEVRKGIDAFNEQDYTGTVRHFVKAKTTAKVNAKVDPEPEADALLDAVEYYANLDPKDYPEAARTSEHFARNKTITLTQCASDEADEPAQET